MCIAVFFFNDTATTEIYTLSLHDALPIWRTRRGGSDRRDAAKSQETLHPDALGRPLPAQGRGARRPGAAAGPRRQCRLRRRQGDRKSTRLNSSHANISYAVFCLKKKKTDT